jgi:DnaK suppressor protein
MTTADLKQMLLGHRGEVQSQVHGRIHVARTAHPSEVLDMGEDSEADIQQDIEFALIQMKAETLNRIDEALGRLDVGKYGYCSECGHSISVNRLRALPFAVRCNGCEEGRDRDENRARHRDVTRGRAFALLSM